MLNRWIALRRSTAVRLPSIYALPFNFNHSRSVTSGKHFHFFSSPGSKGWSGFQAYRRKRSKAEGPLAAAGFKPQFRRRFPHLQWHTVVGGELTDCQECTVGISLITEHLDQGQCSCGPPSIHPEQPLTLHSDCVRLPYWPHWIMCSTNNWTALFTNRWSIAVLQTVTPTTGRINIGFLFQDSSEKYLGNLKK